ncbi:MAK10-like protein [Tanacetum coccineum]
MCPSKPQPQALETSFEARVQDYMATHTERMERFKKAIFKQREEIDDIMAKMFGLLKELTAIRTPKKDAAYVTSIKKVDKVNGAENRTGDEPVRRGLKHTDALSDVNVMPLSIYNKLTNERPAEIDIRLSLASHSYIYPLGIAEDVLVEVVGYVYPVDFMILDIKKDEKSPFILGTPLLTTAKAVIKIEKETKNDIEPIAPAMTVNRLILEWEERIKLHQEKEMEFDQWRSKNFNIEFPTPKKGDFGLEDEGGVT